VSLAGQGVVAIWHDIVPEARADFYEWHNREHIPERVGIPGFLRGRRYVALDARPEFFTLYETAGPQVLDGADYLERLNHPTPWTRRAVLGFRQTSRSLCRVALSLGTGQGGFLVTLRYEVAEGREEEQRRWLCHRALPELADRPGVAGAHLCLADRAASAIMTEEKRGREVAAVPGWVILVEGGAEPALLDAACQAALPEAALVAAGAVLPVARGLYQLQYSRVKTPTTAG
jgi:glutathione S-transferase